LPKFAIVFAVEMNFLPLPHHIALTILHFIGQIFISWLALTLPATAQTTAKANLPFYQIQQLDQSAVLPFWKESATSVWSLLSESLEESTAENEETHDGEPAAKQHQALLARHRGLAGDGHSHRFIAAHQLPLYLQYCSLKIHLI
jgi:hypothetical protein